MGGTAEKKDYVVTFIKSDWRKEVKLYDTTVRDMSSFVYTLICDPAIDKVSIEVQ